MTDPTEPSAAGEPGPAELTEEQLLEQIRQLRVEDILLQTVVTLINLSGRRLTVEEEKDVEQARKGIEAVRALLPLCPEEQVGPIKEALSQLQMIYVRESGQAGAKPAPGAGATPGATPPPEPRQQPKRESRIWTPPGVGER